MISKALTLAAIATTFLASNAAQAQTTATYSTSPQNFTSSLWDFSWSGGTVSNLPVIDNQGSLFSLGTLTATALTQDISNTGLIPTVFPLTLQLSDGRTFSADLLASIQAGINNRPNGTTTATEFNLSTGGGRTIIPIDQEGYFDIKVNSTGSQTVYVPGEIVPGELFPQSVYSPIVSNGLSVTSTFHQGSVPRIPEPGTISLLALGGLAMGGRLLRRKSR